MLAKCSPKDYHTYWVDVNSLTIPDTDWTETATEVYNDTKPIVKEINLMINGQEYGYISGSPYSLNIEWPRKGNRSSRLNISISGIGTVSKKNFEGEWAMFRLFDEGTIVKRTSREFDISWKFTQRNYYDIIISYELKANKSNNPFKYRYFGSYKIPHQIN